jgi:hypothetical protein
MMYTQDRSKDKTIGDLGWEAFWFATHTLLAAFVLALVVGGMTMTHPDPESYTPKLLATALSFFVPMIGGFAIAKAQQNVVARYVWISGLLLFSVVCVWVLDLPTGNGLCENCGALDKLWRTFFDIGHGSGLMGGDGLLVGTWLPLSMIGYAVGASFGLES